MKVQLWDQAGVQIARGAILLTNDPRQAFGVELPQTLSDIQDLLRATYGFNMNVLDHLREYFPDFEWKFHSVPNAREVVRLAGDSDYSWLKLPEHDYSHGIVTARRKVCPDPKRFVFLWFNERRDSWNYEGWPKGIREPGKFRLITSTKEVV